MGRAEWRNEQAAARAREPAAHHVNVTREARRRLEAVGGFQKVSDPAELPADEEIYLATVDAATVAGPVRAGQAFTVPRHMERAFTPSRTMLACSTPALAKLEALRDELVARGEVEKAADVDLEPVHPLDWIPAKRREPRTADER